VNFNDDYLLNRVDLARGIINKVVHLYANYNLYNWSSSCLGLVREIQCSKHQLKKLKIGL